MPLQTYLGKVISHSSSDLGMTTDNEVTQSLRIDEVNQSVVIIEETKEEDMEED